jgi:hypothetical protein
MGIHRTKLKVLLNPILRIFGWSIVSVMQDDTFIRYEIRKYPENCKVIEDTCEFRVPNIGLCGYNEKDGLFLIEGLKK